MKVGDVASKEKQTVGDINNVLKSVAGVPADYDLMLRRIGNAHFVLIGEASHGTHEF